MAESFGTKFSEEEVEKILDPKGFLDLKEYKDYDGIEDIGKQYKSQPPQQEDNNSKQQKKEYKDPENQKEYGFKVKGPEPTRFGDWERKGRVSDF